MVPHSARDLPHSVMCMLLLTVVSLVDGAMVQELDLGGAALTSAAGQQLKKALVTQQLPSLERLVIHGWPEWKQVTAMQRAHVTVAGRAGEAPGGLGGHVCVYHVVTTRARSSGPCQVAHTLPVLIISRYRMAAWALPPVCRT